MRALAPYFIAASAAIVMLLGLLHLLYTFHGPKLLPRDRDLKARMQEVSPVISRETTMWKAWVGFNASHSCAAILFGAVYGYLSLVHSAFQFRSAFCCRSGSCSSPAKLLGALVLGVAALPLPILLALFALPLGPELAVAALLLEVTAESTPPGRWTVWQFRPDTAPVDRRHARHGLMHSATYEHEDALAEMVLWIRTRLSASRGARASIP